MPVRGDVIVPRDHGAAAMTATPLSINVQMTGSVSEAWRNERQRQRHHDDDDDVIAKRAPPRRKRNQPSVFSDERLHIVSMSSQRSNTEEPNSRNSSSSES